jgi:hypothetical protein
MKKEFFKYLFVFVFSQNQMHAMGKNPPSSGGSSSSSSSQATSSSSSSPMIGTYIEQIKSIAENSACAARNWPGRGHAPLGYIKGIGLSFARSLCRLSDPVPVRRSPASLMSKANTNQTSPDAIAWYKSTFDSNGMEINTNSPNTLRSLYTLATGLGMRESSGNYCEGFDTSAGPETASEAEAGLFQTSYNSISASTELRNLYTEYQADPSRCFLNVFKEGADSCHQGYVGSGAGLAYQKLNRSCPAFATEYAMIMLRVLRKHYGPINRKEAEVNLACNGMLRSIQQLVLAHEAQACTEIR